MAAPQTVKFGAIKVYLGDGATPEVFAEPCGLNSKNFTLNKDLNDTTAADCDDPDAAAWKERDVVAKSATIRGEGVIALQSLKSWRDAQASDDSVSMRVEVDAAAASGGGYWQGKFHVSAFEIVAARGNRATVSVTAESDGPITWTAAAS